MLQIRSKLAKRTKHEQTCHDEAVRRSAAQLKANEWSVKADVEGYKRPPTLAVDGENRRPDIIATKNGERRIIEWETPSSIDKDRDQHHVFRTYARRHKNTHSSVKQCSV